MDTEYEIKQNSDEVHNSEVKMRCTEKTDYLPAFFLVIAFIFFPKGHGSEQLKSMAVIFVSIVLEAIPFMLAGSLAGGIIEAFVSRERITSMLPQKGWLTVCIAACAGMVFPVCECAVIPVVRRLLGKGLPLSAAIAYLLGGPVVNPIVEASTALAYAFDWSVVILRVTCGYAIAVVIGIIMGRLFTEKDAVIEQGHSGSCSTSCCCDNLLPVQIAVKSDLKTHVSEPDNRYGCCDVQDAFAVNNQNIRFLDKTAAAFRHGMDDFLSVGHYLIIGAFIAALANTFIDRTIFLSLSEIPFLSIILMMAMAVLLNLCSEADAFIAASFRGVVTPAAQMAFMLTGPVFDLKLLLMYKNIFTTKAIITLVVLILSAVLITSGFIELFYGFLL